MRNVVLCGFMGCGKTTVGRQLAALSGRRFVDMDEYIEQQAGMAVSEIFRQYGEDDFRRRERETCRALAGQTGLVIAAGGGALTFAANVEAQRPSCVIVLLEVKPETVLTRLKGDTSRPLLAREDKETAVRELFAARLPLYRAAAQYTVDGEQPPLAVAKTIQALLGGMIFHAPAFLLRLCRAPSFIPYPHLPALLLDHLGRNIHQYAAKAPTQLIHLNFIQPTSPRFPIHTKEIFTFHIFHL